MQLWYVNVFVSDLERALAFYRDQVGLEVVTEDADFGYAAFDTSGARFAVARTDDTALVGRHTGVGWGVEDVNEAHRALSERGVIFESAPAQQPWGGYMAMFRDPDGNLFYLDELGAR